MFIEPRRAVSVDELLHGMIVQSGNDASIALAELVAGSEEAFVARMNAEAARLGLAEHAFRQRRPGFRSRSTTRPRATSRTLAAALIRDFPEYYPLYSLKEYRYNNITQPNRNRLLWIDPYVDGMKTGHTDAAGWCLIASAKRGERRLLSVVLGAASDAARATESAEAPQLRLPGVRHGAALPVRQAGVDAARVEGRGQRRRRGLPRRPVPHAAEGQGGRRSQLTMTATRAAGRAGRAGPDASAPSRSRSRASRSPSSRWSRSTTCRPASFFGRAWDTVRLWFK